MKVIFRSFNGAEDWAWCNKHVCIIQTSDVFGIMAIDADNDEIIGATLMDNWAATSVQCHFIITNPLALRHKFLDCVFNHMFIERGLKSIYGLVPGDNKKAIKINKHMGFTIKSRLEEAFAVGVDYLLMELKRENCMYIDKAARNG